MSSPDNVRTKNRVCASCKLAIRVGHAHATIDTHLLRSDCYNEAMAELERLSLVEAALDNANKELTRLKLERDIAIDLAKNPRAQIPPLDSQGFALLHRAQDAMCNFFSNDFDGGAQFSELTADIPNYLVAKPPLDAASACRHPVLLDDRNQPGVDIYSCAVCKAELRLNEYVVTKAQPAPAAPTQVWAVENKTFNCVFASRELAEKFVSSTTAAVGLRIIGLSVIGEPEPAAPQPQITRLQSAFKQARADLAVSSGTWSNAASFGLLPEDIGIESDEPVSAAPSESATGVTDKHGAPLFEGDRVRVNWLDDIGITELDCEAVGTVEYMADKFLAAWFVKFDSPFRRHPMEDALYEVEYQPLVQTADGDDMNIHFEKLPSTKEDANG